jgi:hypothetical protein
MPDQTDLDDDVETKKLEIEKSKMEIEKGRGR